MFSAEPKTHRYNEFLLQLQSQWLQKACSSRMWYEVFANRRYQGRIFEVYLFVNAGLRSSDCIANKMVLVKLVWNDQTVLSQQVTIMLKQVCGQ